MKTVKPSTLESAVLLQIEESIELKEYLKSQVNLLLSVANEIAYAFKRGNKIFLFGNGGSAADAQHITAELMGRFYRQRDPFPAIALTTNTSTLTAISNDFGYENTFSRQIAALISEKDIAFGITTSGNSVNVLRALETAKAHKAITIALVGQKIKNPEILDYIISFPSTDTPRIQEAHITVGHIICYLVEELICN